MEISRRTDYAIRMMISICSNGDEGLLSTKRIAEYDAVPYQFARGIQHELAEAGLITTKRGVHGGSTLARPADEISLYDIVEAMQGTLLFSRCEADPCWCARSNDCPVREVWCDLDADIHKRLKAVSLAWLTENYPGKLATA